MIDLDLLLKLVKAMNDEGVEYITFGAMAMWAHGIVRATEDGNFFIAPTPENVARLKRALRSVWDDPSIDEIDTDELIGDYPSVRYGPPGTDLYMDFLTRLGEMYSYENLQSEMKEIDGVPMRVVTPRQLFEMKRDTVRSKDKADADALRLRFKFEGE